jgi:hypothetical protein
MMMLNQTVKSCAVLLALGREARGARPMDAQWFDML